MRSGVQVVSHKAFLRNLEKGPLSEWKEVSQSPSEFKNAELRKYMLRFCS